ncbi:aspartate dehydrogenase [Sulfitobacter aestuariivivens]|uniref:L-aspartate dehydrogenase n=1 Tax=Sulfitobacter aestuariivivens TaxID=2766981 RepID=A0A927D5M6_9RHOB|nr:aspartate dehydrogenase [Sulfitobacter aestuariivivens]MBD3663902.1 aspartate dehydrogenase [Sulfitobacter aestuariivivens]
MNIALIGNGAIAKYIVNALTGTRIRITALLVRPERAAAWDGTGPRLISTTAELPEDTQLVVDCAGHSALRAFGPAILSGGRDLITVSIGALADAMLLAELTAAGQAGGARLHLASGAIGGLDVLRAARAGQLRHVHYTGRKPPKGWAGSPAEKVLDLPALKSGSAVHFEGTARQAALAYPKNANVAAAVALAGLGLDDTRVTLIADADATGNTHQIEAQGDFGELSLTLTGHTLPDTPRTSALAAMSVLCAIQDRRATIHF